MLFLNVSSIMCDFYSFILIRSYMYIYMLLDQLFTAYWYHIIPLICDLFSSSLRSSESYMVLFSSLWMLPWSCMDCNISRFMWRFYSFMLILFESQLICAYVLWYYVLSIFSYLVIPAVWFLYLNISWAMYVSCP